MNGDEMDGPPGGQEERPEREEFGDGRTMRRERNIERALDAVLDLAGEGIIHPSLEEIAERAGVSHRSLYRYFDDRTALLRAAFERSSVRVAPLLEIPNLGEGGLDGRIVAFVKARTDTYWGFGPIARTAYLGLRQDVVREGIDNVRAVLRDQLVAQFAPELDVLDPAECKRTVALLDVAFQFEALEYLARNCDLDASELIDTLERHLVTILQPLTGRSVRER